MIIEDTDLKFCADKVRQFTDGYHWSDGEKSRSIAELYWLAMNKEEKPILLRKFPMAANSHFVRSVYVERKNDFLIGLLDGLSQGDARFAQCKELFQIVLRRPGTETGDIVDHIKNMILRSAPESFDLNLGKPTVSESLAEIAASEWLYPYEHRVEHKKSGVRAAQIAVDYEIPRNVVEIYLTEPFMARLSGFFG